jgi:hypothetical protein
MRRNATRALAPALLVLALVGFVAVASTGATPGGGDETRRPSDAILDAFFSLGLVAMILGGAFLIWGLSQRKLIAREIAYKRYPRTGLLTFLTIMSVVTLFAYWRLQSARIQPSEGLEDVIPRPDNEFTPRPTGPDEFATPYDPEFAWIPVLVVTALAAIGAAAYVAARRRRLAEAGEEDLAAAVAEVLDDTLDDLRAEADPRRAVIAAYARLERTLAAHGLPRKKAETPEEYTGRVLRQLDVRERAVRRLTELFARAKFSQHEVDARMKDEAIDALQLVRDELREARERELAEQRVRSTELAASGGSAT